MQRFEKRRKHGYLRGLVIILLIPLTSFYQLLHRQNIPYSLLSQQISDFEYGLWINLSLAGNMILPPHRRIPDVSFLSHLLIYSLSTILTITASSSSIF